jgi:hypothetical protein
MDVPQPITVLPDVSRPRDWQIYLVAALGVLVRLGLIATPTVLTRNQGPFPTAPLWVSLSFSLTGQALLFAGGIAAAVPRARRRWRASRVAAGLCIGCGYDLCRTPDRCPECGQAKAVESVEANTQ